MEKTFMTVAASDVLIGDMVRYGGSAQRYRYRRVTGKCKVWSGGTLHVQFHFGPDFQDMFREDEYVSISR